MTSAKKSGPLDWQPDILPGFESAILAGLADAKGPIDAVLVRRRCQASGTAAVLYVHGFIDYFFQSHLADFYHARGLHFYAIDLRRHGRSLRTGQLPNFTVDLDEYLQDLTAAITAMRTHEHIDWLLLNGHSTGGLVAALYAHRGPLRQQVDAIFLNSPFLDMNIPAWQSRWVEPVLSWLGGVFPHLRYPGISPVYAKSIHAEHRGHWQFKADWKPIAGFPVYAGWFRAIHRAQAEIADGLHIQCPCLVLHSSRSLRTRAWTDQALTADIVLNIGDIERLAPGLGKQLEIHAIKEGVHDLVLSSAPARAEVWRLLSDWLVRLGCPALINANTDNANRFNLPGASAP